MTRNIARLLVLAGLLSASVSAAAFENLVYTWRGFPGEIPQGTVALDNLKAHISQIDIWSSQAYHIDEHGVVYGSQNPQMLQLAKDKKVKIMPLVGNMNLDRAVAHAFLNDPVAVERAIQSLLTLCKQNQFAGIQVDFEAMSFLDKEVFTRFYQKLADVLHKNGFQISIAIVPMLTDDAPATHYLKGKYEGWAGVYDYKAIGQSSDFVTLMAYDQHGGITTPGPMAGITWDESIVQYALKYISADKLSLGVPWHSAYWYTGKQDGSLKTISTDVSFADLSRLVADNHLTLRWDDEDKVHYAMFRHHFLYEYIFAEDADSFAAKLDLVKKYHLRGVSNWCLGEEDPRIWKLLPRATK